MAEHGMVLVTNDRLIVPTCLCGWIGAGQRGAGGFSLARTAWRGHIELDKRLSESVAIYMKEED